MSGPRGSYDALLLVSFGGPEGPDDVVPFLENVTRGRGVPRERLVEVGAHYDTFGGVSPINAQNRELRTAIESDLRDAGLELPVFWGNRNWAPYLSEAMESMKAAGLERVLCFVTSAYSSYSGCRQYRENLADALVAIDGAGESGESGGFVVIDKVRHYFDHPGFVEPMVDSVLTAYAQLDVGGLPGPDRPGGVELVFTTHSVPVSIADTAGPTGGAYVAQHRAVAERITTIASQRLGRELVWDLVFQSRSGPPHVPWLEPDICDHLTSMRARGAAGAVMIPIGFVSDHVEVIWDLDTEAMQQARDIGLPCVRASTVGVDPRFVSMVRELVLERVGLTPARALSDLGPSHDVCPANCCPNLRGPRPAACGSD